MLLTILMTLMIILTIICKPVDNRARQQGKKNRDSVTTTLGKPRCAGSEFPQAAVLPPTPAVTITSERTGVERTKEMKSRPANEKKENTRRRSKEIVEPTQKSDSFASPSSNEEADGTSQDAPSIPIREDGRSYETEMDTAKSPFVEEKCQRKKMNN